MPISFKDNYNHNHQWQYTSITVPKKTKPYYQLFVGGEKRRFKLASKDLALYWGCISSDYYNVWLLKSHLKWQLEHMPIPPIVSADIETFKEKSQQKTVREKHSEGNFLDYAKYWANFFAKALARSKSSFLHAGNWYILPNLSKDVPKDTMQHRFIPDTYWLNCQFISLENTKNHYGISQNQFGCVEITDDEQLLYLDWQNLLPTIPLKVMPSAEDGRVKWWRKKVREGVCPPILVWYQNNIQTHVIVDGHARLQAYRLENVKPNALIITAIEHKTYDNTSSRIDALRGIKHSLEHSDKLLDVDKLNDLMINLYEPQDLYNPYIRSKIISDFDDIWLKEVRLFCKNTPIDQSDLADMIEGN